MMENISEGGVELEGHLHTDVVTTHVACLCAESVV